MIKFGFAPLFFWFSLEVMFYASFLGGISLFLLLALVMTLKYA